MAISITCGCGKKLKAPDELAGKRVKCPACGAQMQAPQLAAPPAVEVAPGDEAAPDLSNLLEERLLEPSATNCPQCGLTVVSGSTRCLRCGCDYRTGAMPAPPRTASPPPSVKTKKPSNGGADEYSLRDYVMPLVVVAGAIAAMVGVVYLGMGWVQVQQSRSVADELMKNQPPKATLLKEKGAEAVPGLISYLNGKDSGRRSRAAYVLGFIGDSDSVAALADQLDPVNDASHRVAVADALAHIGPAAQEAAPALCESLQAPEIEVRVAAAGALGKTGGNAAEAVPALSAAVQTGEIELRVAAARALGAYGQDAKAAVPALIGLLDVTDNDLCLAAAEGLGGIGPAAGSAQAVLFKALDSKHPGMSSAALRAVAQIAPKDPAVFAALEAGLKDRATLIAAADALASMGPAARATVPALIEARLLAKNIVLNRSFTAAQKRDSQPTSFKREYNAAGEVVSERKFGPDRDAPVWVSADESVAVDRALQSVADSSLADVVQALLTRQLPRVADGFVDSDPVAQKAAAAALLHQAGNEVVLALLRDQRPAVRIGAANVLGKRKESVQRSISDIRTYSVESRSAKVQEILPLLEALGDENEVVRTTIAELWRSLSGIEFLPEMIDNPAIRHNLEKALAK